MSATIVEHDNRAPLDAGFAARLVDSMAEGSGVPSVGIAGDANAWTSRPAGQLWERVAEGHKVRHSDAERMRYAVAILTGHDPGPKLSTFRNPTVSGIIRAGERVR